MRYLLFFFLVFLFSFLSYSQTGIRGVNAPAPERSLNENEEEQEEPEDDIEELKAPIEDYQIISVKGDTTSVDTTLTIQKEYKLNYLRKDNFGLLPFSNIGQT